ncbi:MAG: DNA-directed RNA polymerase [Candidatus Freyarchaeota archaeon]|nr:DNA-directed RNA polymerase [Candidatus Jordarchaeia archaeon]
MFCPKDGALMVPKKKDGKTVLVCKKCGYETPVSDEKKYKLVVKIPHTTKDKTAVVEKELTMSFKQDEEEREELRRQMLEFLAEEG